LVRRKRGGTDGSAMDEQLDMKAFETLVRQHHRRLLAYALALVPARDVAEDLAQDTFVTACRNRTRFDASRDFGAWVRGILRNKYREWTRARQEVPVDDAILTALDTQHRQWDRTEQTPGHTLRALRRCIQRLPATLRRVVELFYLDGLAGEVVADRVDASHATVRKRLQRARQNLAECVRAALGSG